MRPAEQATVVGRDNFYDSAIEGIIEALYYGQRDSLGNRPVKFKKTFSR